MKLTLNSIAILAALASPHIANAEDGTPTFSPTFTTEIPKTICTPSGPDACADFTQWIDLRSVRKFRFSAQAMTYPNPEKTLIVQYSLGGSVWKCLGTPCAKAVVKSFAPPLGLGAQVGHVFSNTVPVQDDARKQNVRLRFSYLGTSPAPAMLNTGLAQFYQ